MEGVINILLGTRTNLLLDTREVEGETEKR